MYPDNILLVWLLHFAIKFEYMDADNLFNGFSKNY